MKFHGRWIYFLLAGILEECAPLTPNPVSDTNQHFEAKNFESDGNFSSTEFGPSPPEIFVHLKIGIFGVILIYC